MVISYRHHHCGGKFLNILFEGRTTLYKNSISEYPKTEGYNFNNYILQSRTFSTRLYEVKLTSMTNKKVFIRFIYRKFASYRHFQEVMTMIKVSYVQFVFWSFI